MSCIRCSSKRTTDAAPFTPRPARQVAVPCSASTPTDMEHKIKTPCELEVTVIADVSPSVPPVPCMGPDHPAYSDPGDPGGASISAVLLTNLKTGEFIDITDC